MILSARGIPLAKVYMELAKHPHRRFGMVLGDQPTPLEPALQHLGFILDELSAQGLTLWQDTGQRWRWAWAATTLHSERGFWALGEAIVDAVVTRYPTVFDTTNTREGTREERRTA
jgi:hypothetical protein